MTCVPGSASEAGKPAKAGRLRAQVNAVNRASANAPTAMRYQANTPKPWRLTKRTNGFTTTSADRNADDEADARSARRRASRASSSSCRDRRPSAPSMVGMARKNENSAEAARSTRKTRAPMMVAPERDTPGIMARHWQKPTNSAVFESMSSTDLMRGRCAKRSMIRMAMPPTMNATATTIGLSSSALMYLCSGDADHGRRQEGHDDGRREAHAPAARAAITPPIVAKILARVEHAHGEDRAELDHDLEDLAGRSLEMQQLLGEDDVAGRGDRQELGEALDEADQRSSSGAARGPFESVLEALGARPALFGHAPRLGALAAPELQLAGRDHAVGPRQAVVEPEGLRVRQPVGLGFLQRSRRGRDPSPAPARSGRSGACGLRSAPRSNRRSRARRRRPAPSPCRRGSAPACRSWSAPRPRPPAR